MKRLRLGVLGTGNIARQFCAAVADSRRCSVSAVGSRSADSAETFARDFGIQNAHGSYEALLADRDVDAVYLSAPNSLHHPWTLAALRAGKHVLCEKPFALDAAQAQEMFDAADCAGLLVVEAFMYLSHPQTLAIVQAVRNRAIGEAFLVRTNFCYATKKVAGNVRFDRKLGGGALMDVGCYCTSFARLIFDGEPESISATARFHESGVDELTSVVMSFAGNRQSTFTCAMRTHNDNTAHVCGDEGWIETAWPWKPGPDRSGYTIARSVPPKQDQGGGPRKSAAEPPPRQRVEIPAPQQLFALEADDFAAAILDGAPARVSRAFTLGNMRTIDEIRRQIGLRFD